MTDPAVHWVFDDPERFITMSACDVTRYDPVTMNNNNGRWNVSNLHWYWRWGDRWYERDVSWFAHGLDDRPARYVYPIGAFSSPDWWAGMPGNVHGLGSMFDLIPHVVVADAAVRRCVIAIDNLNEGFHMPRLWRFMHDECHRLGIPPNQVMYLQSNLLEPDAYERWAVANGIGERLRMISFCHLMYQQRVALPGYGHVTYADHMIHKGQHETKLFSCLNRIPRWHRQDLMLRLIESGLWQHGRISHGPLISDWTHDVKISTLLRSGGLLPAIVDDHDFDNNKAMHLAPDVYLDTWISIITETHADDDPDQLFISEKVWKPIFTRQPFLVLGNPGTHHHLERMGYQMPWGTWRLWDLGPYEDRVRGILDDIRELSRTDLRAWFDSNRAACEANHQLFMNQQFIADATYAAITGAVA